VHLSGTQNLRPAELSGGMRKRVSLARCLTMNPKVILYDEPTAGLDPPTSDRIDAIIKEMNEKFDVTSVVVTHDLVSVFRLAHHVYMLDGGKILFSGNLDELESSTNEKIKIFLDRLNV
jgi:phospholipid/cholesterol/gamma-HCH transport system ATP-binding protein